MNRASHEAGTIRPTSASTPSCGALRAATPGAVPKFHAESAG